MKKHTKIVIRNVFLVLLIVGMIFGGVGGTLFFAYQNKKQQEAWAEMQAELQKQFEAQLQQQAQVADASDSGSISLPSENSDNSINQENSATDQSNSPVIDFGDLSPEDQALFQEQIQSQLPPQN